MDRDPEVTRLESDAFWQASLRSERLRILGLIIIGVIAGTINVVRILGWSAETEGGLLRSVIPLFSGFVAYELVMLYFVSRASRLRREPPAWLWWLNVFIETSLPSLGLWLMTQSYYLGPRWALTTPPILSYFLFILLSTLRLSPPLSLATGLISGGGYVLVVSMTLARDPDGVGGYGLPMYVTFAATFVIAGAAAAAVARQIRIHVVSALNEAQTQRRIERIEHDLGIARSIQQALLPKTQPGIAGYDIAGWSQPADQTGGDYYDWQELPDGRLAVSLADVTGHGIGPALVTAVCRAYARATFPSAEELGRLADRVNDLLVEDLDQGRFVTFVVAILTPDSGKADLLSAGHGPIFLYRAAADRVELLDAHGVPFGIMPGQRYGPPTQLQLATGDMLVLITDGFFEWVNARGEQFGVERLSNAIRGIKAMSAREEIEQLHRAVVAFSEGAPPTDDLTAVVIRRVAAPT